MVVVTTSGDVHVLTHSRERPLQPARTAPLPGGGGPGGPGARLLRATWVPQRPRTLLFLVATEVAPAGRPALVAATWLLPERAGPAEPATMLEAALPAAAAAAGPAMHDSDLFAVACEVGAEFRGL